jgi:phosphatidylinositol glycan class H protein
MRFHSPIDALSCYILLESIVILPPHGIQLETHRGFSNQWSIHSSKRFIPSARLADVVINEGIKGWNVLYYLVAVEMDASRDSSLEVAYEVSSFCTLKTVFL